MKTRIIKRSTVALLSMLVICLVAALVIFKTADNATENPVLSGTYLGEGDGIVIMDNGKSDFKTLVIGSANYTGASQTGMQLADSYFYKFSNDINAVKSSGSYPKENVITYGRVSDIPLSVKLADAIDSLPADSYAWGIAYENGVLALYANAKYAVDAPVSKTLSAHDLFDDLYAGLSDLTSDKKFTVKEGMFIIKEVTAKEYQRLLEEDDAKYDSEKAERMALRVEYLKEEIGRFSNTDFGTAETGSTLTTDFGSAASGSPDYYPTNGEHPRVIFTKDDIPAIRESIESSVGTAEYRKFVEYLDMEYLTGILGEPRKQSRGYHNYDAEVLMAIQANALAYAIYGEEYYGYTAIYAIKNFLTTLHVDYIYSDQCREFGYVMYISACVYDWCYDLLTEEDKVQIPLGVEHKLCRGNVPNTMNGILSTSSTVKMEMGFPPKSQSAVGGHGSEFQLLRDYLAMSIAVYDEYPSWYELVGGRFYNEYAVVRRDYYAAGIYPQGMSYGPYRFLADCYGAALIQAATGKNAYSADIANVLLTFVSNETAADKMFTTGDCGPTTLPKMSIGMEALIVSYVLGGSDVAGLLRSISGEFVSGYTTANLEYVSLGEYFIFSSRESAENGNAYRTELPLVWYNGGYMGQYVVRNAFDSDAAVVMMRIGERTTGNHDHLDAGTFQIYYKGLVSGATGGSGTYGSNHWRYYYQATVSDNGLLIFDPSLASNEPDLKVDGSGAPVLDSFGNVSYNNAAKLFYTGGQTRFGEPSSYSDWISGRYDRAEIKGNGAGYTQTDSPRYAYIASDITKAYTTSQASYVGRTMLTVYTDDPEYPMIFFVFDNIDAAKDEFVKKFLLQINGKGAPTVDEDNKTVTVEDGDGQLVLQNILGAQKIEAIGGGYGSNFVINGTNCVDKSIDENHSTQNSWGRVELSATGENTDLMLNVIYVSDKGNEKLLRASAVSAYDKATQSSVLFEGATIGSVTALFSTEYDRTVEEICFTADGEGLMTYYIGGLFEGTWRVSIDGAYSGTVYATKDSGLVTFRAPAGAEITLTPGNDIRPAGSEKITFITNGGSFTCDVPSFYFPGTEFTLPTDLVRNFDEFSGWYLDKGFTQPISVLGSDITGAVTVYAKWSAVFVNEDYSETKIDIVDKTSGSASSKGIGYVITDNAKTTLTTDNVEGSLFWQTDGAGPSIYMDPSAISIATMNEERITYTFEFADAGTDKDMTVEIRVRNADKVAVALLKIANGKVYFDEKEIATLSEDSFTTVMAVIDFSKNEVRAYTAESEEEFVKSVSLPPRASFTRELFAMRASSAGAIKIGSIKLVEGDSVKNTPIPPVNSDYIEFPKEAILPAGFSNAYTPDTKAPLPTDGVSAVIDGVQKELVGWYLDEALTEPVSFVPDGVSGKFTVYAKWRSVLLKEDYSSTELNFSEVTMCYYKDSATGIQYYETNGKKTTFKTENGYLLWEQIEGSGSQILIENATLSQISENQVTYVFSFADAGNGMKAAVRVRNKDKAGPTLFSIENAKIIFNSAEIATLDENSFTTVIVVLDFTKGEIRAYTSESDAEYKMSASLPERSTFTREMFSLYSLSTGSLKVGLIKIIEGDAAKTDSAPTAKDYIEFPKEAVLPDGFSSAYTPDAKTPLPDSGVYAMIGGTKNELVGWYLDEALTEPVSFVPDGVSGKFTVYAKWMPVLLDEDYSMTNISYVDASSVYYQVNNLYYLGNATTNTFKTENGYLLWKADAANPTLYNNNMKISDIASKQITYVFEFADAGLDADMNIQFYFRDVNKTTTYPFSIVDGVVTFDGEEITALSENEFTTVTVVVDFETNEIRFSTSASAEIYTKSVTLTDQSTFTRDELLVLRAASAGAIKIGSIKVLGGDALAE